MELTTVAVLTKRTKNFVRYDVPDDMEPRWIGTLYIPKELLPDQPDVIVLSITNYEADVNAR